MFYQLLPSFCLRQLDQHLLSRPAWENANMTHSVSTRYVPANHELAACKSVVLLTFTIHMLL